MHLCLNLVNEFAFRLLFMLYDLDILLKLQVGLVSWNLKALRCWAEGFANALYFREHFFVRRLISTTFNRSVGNQEDCFTIFNVFKLYKGFPLGYSEQHSHKSNFLLYSYHTQNNVALVETFIQQIDLNYLFLVTQELLGMSIHFNFSCGCFLDLKFY